MTDPMEDLIRTAMASGAACFAEKVSRREIDQNAPLGEAFGDFPAEFMRIRSHLIADAVAAYKAGAR